MRKNVVMSHDNARNAVVPYQPELRSNKGHVRLEAISKIDQSPGIQPDIVVLAVGGLRFHSDEGTRDAANAVFSKVAEVAKGSPTTARIVMEQIAAGFSTVPPEMHAQMVDEILSLDAVSMNSRTSTLETLMAKHAISVGSGRIAARRAISNHQHDRSGDFAVQQWNEQSRRGTPDLFRAGYAQHDSW